MASIVVTADFFKKSNEESKPLPTKLELQEKIPIVTKEWSDKRKEELKTSQPRIWSGDIFTVRSEDGRFIVIEFFNKYGGFFETHKYPIEQHSSNSNTRE